MNHVSPIQRKLFDLLRVDEGADLSGLGVDQRRRRADFHGFRRPGPIERGEKSHQVLVVRLTEYAIDSRQGPRRCAVAEQAAALVVGVKD